MKKISLNPEAKLLRGEVAIDLYTNGMGVYCGSFAVREIDAFRVMFAINTAHQLLIDGYTSDVNLKAIIRK